MGKPITVDSDDLLLVLEVTGVIKNLEAAMNGRPQRGEQHRLKYTRAHQALNLAYNRGYRATSPDFAFTREPPTRDDIVLLLILDDGEGSPVCVAGMHRQFPDVKLRDWHGLAAKGLIEMGTRFEGFKWANDEREKVSATPDMWARITEKGEEALRMAKTPAPHVTGPLPSFASGGATEVNPDTFGEELREAGRKLARANIEEIEKAQAEFAEGYPMESAALDGVLDDAMARASAAIDAAYAQFGKVAPKYEEQAFIEAAAFGAYVPHAVHCSSIKRQGAECDCGASTALTRLAAGEIAEEPKKETIDLSEAAPTATCALCGGPMPIGEEMFKYHGFSGPCPGIAATPKETK